MVDLTTMQNKLQEYVKNYDIRKHLFDLVKPKEHGCNLEGHAAINGTNVETLHIHGYIKLWEYSKTQKDLCICPNDTLQHALKLCKHDELQHCLVGVTATYKTGEPIVVTFNHHNKPETELPRYGAYNKYLNTVQRVIKEDLNDKLRQLQRLIEQDIQQYQQGLWQGKK